MTEYNTGSRRPEKSPQTLNRAFHRTNIGDDRILVNGTADHRGKCGDLLDGNRKKHHLGINARLPRRVSHQETLKCSLLTYRLIGVIQDNMAPGRARRSHYGPAD